MQSNFFTDFGQGSPHQQIKIDMNVPQFPADYMHNVMVLEIANNFQDARWLMYRHKEGKLKTIKDALERDWFNFLIQNKIDILTFEKGEEEKFIGAYFKRDIPENEKSLKKD